MQAGAVQSSNEGKLKKTTCQLFKTHGYPAAVLDFHEKGFNKMSFPVVFIVAVPRFDSIGFRGNAILCVMFIDIFPVMHGSMGFIRQNSTSGNLQLIQAFL